MKGLRKQFIKGLFEVSNEIYIRVYKKKEAWNITKAELLCYAEDSLGYNLGLFLDENNFELIPKVERHDCYHVLTGYNTKVEDEIALQYLCLGNGKHSAYLFGAVILGTIILPDYLGYYLKSFRKGRDANTFHNLEFKSLLTTNMSVFRQAIFFQKRHIPAPKNSSPVASSQF